MSDARRIKRVQVQWRGLTLALLVAAAFLAGTAEAQTGPVRVSPDARAIQAWRLTPDLVAKVDQVTRAMDGHVPPSRRGLAGRCRAGGRPDDVLGL